MPAANPQKATSKTFEVALILCKSGEPQTGHFGTYLGFAASISACSLGRFFHVNDTTTFERKPLSTLEEIEAFAAQLPDIEEVVPHFGISCLKKDGTIVIYADYGPLPKRVESSE